MSGFEIDLDEIEGLPAMMRSHQSDLTGATTVTAPDTGATTAGMRAAVDHLAGLAGSFADDLGSLGRGLDYAVSIYGQTDGEASLLLDFFGEGLYS